MATTVIIPTAGTGSRMGNYTKNLNKALLPYKDKPILAHIIDQFPNDTHFIIPVGYLADQVRDFCEIAYKQKSITFLDVTWDSAESGTGYTLLNCKDYIDSPFWYIPCDTYFDEPVLNKASEYDCYFVKQVNQRDSHLYTMFEVNDTAIQKISFKETQPDSWSAFTGLMYIHDWSSFFSDLFKLQTNEFIGVIKPGARYKCLESWQDFGNPEIYKLALAKSQKFDFSKKDEVTYICNNRVVKWWLNNSVSEKKYQKTLVNPSVFPNNCAHKGNFMGYDFFPGKTLYEFNDPVIFRELIKWLKETVWINTTQSITHESRKFYKDKSLDRIQQFLEKYPQLCEVTHVNGAEVKSYDYYLNKIDWEYLATHTLPGFIHGDLQFDNVVISSSGEFKIIDWRHEFADNVECGDIYYDLAKMAGGFIVNYANIKNHNFDIEIDGTEVTLSIPNIDYIQLYQDSLTEFIVDQGWDYHKVRQLIPIIFWNMSPLHTAPFDMFLWYLGIKLFQDLENEILHQSE